MLGAIAIYLLRKLLWVALFVAIGIAAGVLLDKQAPKVYCSEAIVRSNNLAIPVVVDNISKLNNLCRQRNYRELALQLNISELDAEKISTLSAQYGLFTSNDRLNHSEQPLYYAEKYAWNDTTLTASKFVRIVVEVFDEDIYPTLMQGLLTFISNNAFGYKMNLLRVEQLKEQIAYVEKEIATLQQVQATYTASSNTPTVQLDLNGALQKSEQVQLHEAIDRLYYSKISLEREYTLFTQPATVVSDFSKTYRPTVSLLKRTTATSAVTVALGLMALLLWENRKRIGIVARKA